MNEVSFVNSFLDVSEHHEIKNVGWDIAYEEAKRRAIHTLHQRIKNIEQLTAESHKSYYRITDVENLECNNCEGTGFIDENTDCVVCDGLGHYA